MCRRALVQTLPDESLAEEQLDIFFRPGLGGETLQKHHNLLEVHFDKLVGPLNQESSADVKVEFGESLFFCL